MSLEVAGISIFTAFLAGLLSCASPCVLPLLPAYMGYLTGSAMGGSTATVGGEGSIAVAAVPGVRQQSPVLHALSFVGGFSLVFILFGISLGVIGFFLRDQQDIILKVSGGLLIVMGLHLSQVITIPFLEQEKRFDVGNGARVGYMRSFFVGSAFSAGWSPCIGPTLGAIMALAIGSGTVAQAGVLLTAYSLGLGVPFVAMGVAFNGIQPLYGKLKRHMGLLNYISGALLIIVGILVFTDSLVNFNSFFNFGFLGDVSGNV
ncbi:MAG TPA: cytochrome c biogenesis CcdA family protein [Dehalococcoidia bacterium]|nr:cytochrome c biogenesis CcdA family protein [Dehalococcoidia bacterium]